MPRLGRGRACSRAPAPERACQRGSVAPRGAACRPAAHRRVRSLHCQPNMRSPAPRVTGARCSRPVREPSASAQAPGCSLIPAPRPGRAAAQLRWSGACSRRARRAPARRAPVTAPKLTKRADVARNTRRAQPLSARSCPRNAVANGADVSISAAGTCPRAQRLAGGSLEAVATPSQHHATVSRCEQQGRAGCQRRAAQQGARAIRQSVSARPA